MAYQKMNALKIKERVRGTSECEEQEVGCSIILSLLFFTSLL